MKQTQCFDKSYKLRLDIEDIFFQISSKCYTLLYICQQLLFYNVKIFYRDETLVIISAVDGVLVFSLMIDGGWISFSAKKNQLKPNKTPKKNRIKSGSSSSNMRSKRIHLSKFHSGRSTCQRLTNSRSFQRNLQTSNTLP